MSSSTVPSPLAVAAFAKKRQVETIAPPTPPAMPVVVAHFDPEALANEPVTLGTIENVEVYIHDGEVKAKNLRPRARVRALVRGVPRGSERIVKSVTRIGNGSKVRVEFHSAHPTQEYPAAYRWFDESLVGVECGRIVRTPGFVPAHSEA